MSEVQEAHYPDKKIATVIQPAGKWWDAEDYHQECAFFLRPLSLAACSLQQILRSVFSDSVDSQTGCRPAPQPDWLRMSFCAFFSIPRSASTARD